MKRLIFFVLIIFSLSLPVAAQSGWGGRRPGADGGIFAEAAPASQGRTITVGGRLLPLRKINHNFNINGYVDEILVEVGERVDVGRALIRIKRDAVGETFRPVFLESRVKGVVSEIHVYETEQVSSGGAAVTIIDNSGYILQTTISDRDAQAVRNLGSISITAITPDGNSFTGKIVRVSQEPDYNTGLFSVTMEFRKQTGLFLGMVLFVDLPVEKAAGITVAKSSLVIDRDNASLWILNNENILSLRTVTTGIEADGKIAIVEGLVAGERYLTQISGNEEDGMALKDLIRRNMTNQDSGKE